MRINKLVLFAAIAVLGLAVSAQAAPTITVGNYDLLPNTPGQKIPLYVSGIVLNDGPLSPSFQGNVAGVVLSVAINEGGVGWPQYGGLPGPAITDIDAFSGPTIWAPPNVQSAHVVENTYFETQLAQISVLPTEVAQPWVNVTDGLLATLIIDTSGFASGTYRLTLSGGVIQDELGPTVFLRGFPYDPTFIYQYFSGTAGQITIVPEPSGVVLAAIGLIGLAARGWRRKR